MIRKDERLPERVRALLRDELLPQTRDHARTLKRLIGIR